MKNSIKIGIIAGEHSGDILGENLLKSLKKTFNVEIFGVGGPKMESQGLKSAFDFNDLNIMGLVDPILNYSKIMSHKKDLCNLLQCKSKECEKNTPFLFGQIAQLLHV